MSYENIMSMEKQLCDTLEIDLFCVKVFGVTSKYIFESLIRSMKRKDQLRRSYQKRVQKKNKNK
jgi:hypothetical protein